VVIARRPRARRRPRASPDHFRLHKSKLNALFFLKKIVACLARVAGFLPALGSTERVPRADPGQLVFESRRRRSSIFFKI
jgi:hypothetical protein